MKTRIIISIAISIILLTSVNYAQAQFAGNADQDLWQPLLNEDGPRCSSEQFAPPPRQPGRRMQMHNNTPQPPARNRRSMQSGCQGPQCGPSNRGHARGFQGCQDMPQCPMMQQQGRRSQRQQMRDPGRGQYHDRPMMAPQDMQGPPRSRGNRQFGNRCQGPQCGPSNRGHARGFQGRQDAPPCPMMQQQGRRSQRHHMRGSAQDQHPGWARGNQMGPQNMQGPPRQRGNRQFGNRCQGPQCGPQNRGHARGFQGRQDAPPCPMMQQQGPRSQRWQMQGQRRQGCQSQQSVPWMQQRRGRRYQDPGPGSCQGPGCGPRNQKQHRIPPQPQPEYDDEAPIPW